MSDELETLWWHVYMGSMPEMCKPDGTGYKAPGLATLVFGESTMEPSEVADVMPSAETMGGGVVPYIASFDHDPSPADLAPYRPEGYEE